MGNSWASFISLSMQTHMGARHAKHNRGLRIYLCVQSERNGASAACAANDRAKRSPGWLVPRFSLESSGQLGWQRS